MQYNAMNKPGAELAAHMANKMVEEAKLLEEAGAALLDFTNSGPLPAKLSCARSRFP
jgi:3-methyl-2-oxobutanoate hydroxymethyltransferase